jgi:hypothetical protein
MADFNFSKEVHIMQVQDAIELLENYGEVWFFPGNNGDLGSLMLGDQHVLAIRTHTTKEL